MSELKPCPFCSGESIVVKTAKCGRYIACWDCGCRTEEFETDYAGSAYDKATAAWNRRAQPANEPLTLDELRQEEGDHMKDLITEARELCKYSEKIVNQLHTERLDYELEYMPLIETIQVTSELCDALVAMTARAEKTEAENRWIPVTERLPEKPYGCLVIVEQDDYWGEPREVMYPHFVGYDGEQWNDGDGEKIPLEVTHWMPLPAPPKGE